MSSFIEFFGFRDNPFNITPDVDFFFMSSVHQEALASLEYLLETEEGFAVIVGEPGTGKTITIKKFLSQLPDSVEYAYILFPNLSPEEMFTALLEDFGIEPPENATKNRLFSMLKDFLIEKKKEGKKVFVIIDEAQNLPVETLEELRLLSNLETDKEKLIQIILLGQPELERKLELPQLRQLRQRITVIYRLSNLKKDEMIDYINYRLAKAGNSAVRISKKAYDRIFSLTGGNLRLINQIMERALMSAFVKNKHSIGSEEVDEAGESLGFKTQSRKKLIIFPVLILVIFSALGFGYYYFYQFNPKKTQPADKTVPAKKAVETYGTVIPAKLNMRKSAGRDSPVVYVLKKGDRVKIEGEKDGWYRVRFKNIEGWVKKEFLEVSYEKGTDRTDSRE
ncbi:AAA family ATPase [Persephonella sp.]